MQIDLRHSLRLVTFLALWTTAAGTCGQSTGGLLAHWQFNEGQGTVAADNSGNGRQAKIHGAQWVEQGDGFAIRLDGVDDYIDCSAAKSIPITGPVSVEAWIKPLSKAAGLSALMGQDLHSYLLSFYAIDEVFWYIGGGDNNVRGKLILNDWNHVAATFDGARINLWINGQLVASQQSKYQEINQREKLVLGTQGQPHLPRFKGLLDNVRLYNRALTEQEVVAHVKQESSDYGVSFLSKSVPFAAGATHFFESHSHEIDVEQQGQSILMANRQIGIEIGDAGHGFQINRIYSIADQQDFLIAEETGQLGETFEIRMTPDLRGSNRDHRNHDNVGSLMGIMDEMAADAFSVGSHSAKSTSWQREDADGQTTLHLKWHKIPVRGEVQLIDVEVTITLRKGDPMSYWRISVKNPGLKFGLERVHFPLLNLAPIGEAKQNVYLFPREHGGYVEDPFHAPTGLGLPGGGGYYPIDFNMQFHALYDQSSGHGIYLATHDSTPNLKRVQIINTPEQITWKPAHFPPNMTFSEEDFAQSYDCVIGPFQGDWYDACQIYRKWAVQQSWCRKGPLRTRTDSPTWYKEAPFVFYSQLADSAEGTHSVSENIHIAADHFREFLDWADMKLPANWYSWSKHVRGMSSLEIPVSSHRAYNQGRWVDLHSHMHHAGSYPEIPAFQAFTEESHKLRREGGMICPYIALEILDQGPDENSPFATEARPHVVRDLFGVKRTWGGLTAWQMCVGTHWWQQRLADTCKLMVEREHIGGLYLDVMQGAGLPCYWVPHGHSACGGDAIVTGMHEIVDACATAAKQQDPEAIITGENSTENVIDVIDGVLQITLWPENQAPLFAAVYQDYVKRHGLEMSTGVGWQGRYAKNFDDNAFIIESASLFSQGAQIGRMRLRPRGAALSLTNPDQKYMVDFLEQVLGYYKNDTTRMLHAYGQFMRPLEFSQPSPMPLMKYRPGGEFRALWNGVFRSAEGELGVFIINAEREAMDYRSTMVLARHGVSTGALVDVDNITPTGDVTSVHRGARGSVVLEGKLAGRSITMYHVKPSP